VRDSFSWRSILWGARSSETCRMRAGTSIGASGGSMLLLFYMFLMVPRVRRAFTAKATGGGRRTRRRLERCAPAVLQRAEQKRRRCAHIEAVMIDAMFMYQTSEAMASVLPGQFNANARLCVFAFSAAAAVVTNAHFEAVSDQMKTKEHSSSKRGKTKPHGPADEAPSNNVEGKAWGNDKAFASFAIAFGGYFAHAFDFSSVSSTVFETTSALTSVAVPFLGIVILVYAWPCPSPIKSPGGSVEEKGGGGIGSKEEWDREGAERQKQESLVERAVLGGVLLGGMAPGVPGPSVPSAAAPDEAAAGLDPEVAIQKQMWVNMQINLQGREERGEEAMKQLLAEAMAPPHLVRSSSAHGANNCLTDSILLALAAQGLTQILTPEERAAVCDRVRVHLETCHGVPAEYPAPFLSHEDHFDAICQFLRSDDPDLWSPAVVPSKLSITAVVFDRFHRQILQDVHGSMSELPDTHLPVPSSSVAQNQQH